MQRPWSRPWRVSCVLAVGLSTPFLASPAQACSQLEIVIELSYPRRGATDVPTNVVLYAAGEVVGPEGLVLESAAGDRVDVRVTRVLPTGFDVTPERELEPHQRYVLRHPAFLLLGSGPSGENVEFETGSGPAEGAVLTPPELAGAVVLDVVDSPCPNERLCLDAGGSDTALFAANPSVHLSERSPGALAGAYGNAVVPESCLQVWRRDALGNRSELVGLCADDVTRVELSSNAASSCEAYREGLHETGESDELGCTLGALGAPRSSGAGLFAVLGLAAALGAGLRRWSVAWRSRARHPSGGPRHP